MRVRTITLALAATLALCAAVPAANACSREEAIQKMSAVANGLGQKIAQAKTPAETQTLQTGYTRLNEGGDAMAKQDFDKACSIYDSIAKDFDLKS